MAPINPSIQSFFAFPSSAQSSSSPVPGDGFTIAEIHSAILSTPPSTWVPAREYEKQYIEDLMPGPNAVKFTGLIANLNDCSKWIKLPRSAKAAVRMIVTDGTGEITVRLCYSKFTYHLRLGQRVTIFASRLSSVESGVFLKSSALCATLFPEREKTCHVAVDGDNNQEHFDVIRYTLSTSQRMQSLMTLQSFTNGGWEVVGSKIIVVVKSIGARRKVTEKDGSTNHVVTVGILDDSQQAFLSLWGIPATSAEEWKPGETVLLITNPGYNSTRNDCLVLTTSSLVEVNPNSSDAAWLRDLAQALTKRDNVNHPFPSHVSADALKGAKSQALYTLADIDEHAREAPTDPVFGYLSVIVLEMKLRSLYQRKMLLCAQCCGVPLFANVVVAKCKHFGLMVELRINPQAIGRLADESGSVGAGKLLLSDDAWSQLLNCRIADLTSPGANIKDTESRVVHSRVTLVFYWSADVGRLAISAVHT